MIQLIPGIGLKVIVEDPVNGRVGIGTATPTSHLHIHEQSPIASELLFQITTNAGTKFDVDEDGDCGIGGTRSATARCTINDNRHGIVGTADFSTLGGIRIRNQNTLVGTAACFHFESDVAGSGQAGIYGTSLASNEMDIGFYTELPGAQGGRDERMRLTANGRFGIGTATPAASAQLDITSTTGALLLPRMTTVQRDALTAVNGMLLYNSTDDKFQGYENGAWANLI